MARLRGTPPTALGGVAVERVDDLADGGGPLPPTDALRYTLAAGGRVVVRPSGTEPKLKGYLEVVVPVDAPERAGHTGPVDAVDAVDAARIVAAGRLDAIRSDLSSAAGI